MVKILDILPELEAKFRDMIVAVFGDEIMYMGISTGPTGVEIRVKVDKEVLSDGFENTQRTGIKESFFRKRIHMEGLMTEFLLDWVVERTGDTSSRYKVTVIID